MKNNDLLVDLYNVSYKTDNLPVLIKRALSPNSDQIVEYIKQEFTDQWASEAKAALYQNNPTCFIAVDNKKIVGFACYDATAKGFLGPLGVSENHRKNGIGKALILKCLEAMLFDGYAYAIIGGTSEKTHKFYNSVCNSIPIENSRKVYQRMIER